MDTVESLAFEFKARCPETALAVYAPEFAAATGQIILDVDGPTVVTARQFLWILGAVCWRETRAGFARGLIPHGPTGTGDWTARAGHSVVTPHTKQINSKAELPPNWAPAVHQVIVDGKLQWIERDFPWCIPDDGLGWGRDLMQADFASNWDWLQLRDANNVPLWQQPGPAIMKGGWTLYRSFEAFPQRIDCGVAGYNADVADVRRAVAAGRKPGSVTTGGDYVREVLTNAGTWGNLPDLLAMAA